MNKHIWMKYWRKSLAVTYFLRFIPYVRMVGLNGSMVTGLVNGQSDIDLFIVTKNGVILTCRSFTTAFVHLLGLRAYGSKKAGRLCLNRYAVVGYQTILDQNIYHARVFHNLIPLFATKGVYAQYLEDNNWMAKFGYPIVENQIIIQDSILSMVPRNFFEMLLSPFILPIEQWLYQRQLARMKKNCIGLSKSGVVISRKELRFHLIKF